MPNSAIVNRAGRWLLQSGIQEPSGGVARYYRADLQENRLVSTEITGYAISSLVYLHALTQDGAYRAAAHRAGLFLTRTAWNAKLQAFPFEHDETAPAGEYAYFFDSGIIVRGLLSLWRLTREREFLDVAAACGRAMAAAFAADDGAYHPILKLPSKEPLPREPRWSRSPGCYQLKAAMAWYELFEATGEAAFERAYNQALDFALRTQESFLPGSEDSFQVMDRLHAYGYFLEGLLPRLNWPACAAALRAGLSRMAAVLGRIAPVFRRSDVYAQLLRMRLYAEAAGVAPVDRLSAEDEARQLAGFAIDSRDQRLHGGFYFGFKQGQWLPHVNPVSTGFGLQALAMWDQYRNDRLQASRQALI
ncbi:MAG: hypothetical protein HYR60_24420 [Acidobacteria bacterium]|nr:hypothetical protein [Acidobacteriota bacterium]